MSKERTMAFTDAILAIVMTILVLELNEPEQMTWSGIWALHESYLAYALSFFWLGTLWVGLHNEWQHVKMIKTSTLWMNLIVLFWASLFPYTTKLVSDHFNNSVAQVLYGVVVVLTTVFNLLLSRTLVIENPQERAKSRFRQHWLSLDLLIKLVGLVLSLTVYPPAALYSVLLTACAIAIPSHVIESLQGQKE